MSTDENTAPKPDVYARVTSQIINAIEQGVRGELLKLMALLGFDSMP